ncbi:MAG: prepilin peptidase [Rubripirellula sp.]|nr:prepilin peptidase [Rubripirellula sp.]
MRNWLSRIRYPLWCVTAAILLLGAGYIVGVAQLQAQAYPYLSKADFYIPRTVDVLIVIWSFWVASSIASFLNVVAWRMPRGESINGRSHCPRCLAQLKARDNFPVFGWLALQGRCRTCRLPISSRYPIVEGVVGLSLTVVAVAELYQVSLPGQTQTYGGALWFPRLDPLMLVTLTYHVVGLTMCWALGLIRFDGNRLPANLSYFALMFTSVPILVFPTLMVVPWQMEVQNDWQPDGRYVDAMIRVITALVAATALGRYLAKGFCPTADPKLDPLGKSTVRLIDLIVILSIPALLVGWQASPAVIVLASVLAFWIHPIMPRKTDALGRFAVAMPIALTFQIVFWRRLDSADTATGLPFPLWPSENSSPGVMLFWLLMVGVVPLWLREAPVDTDPNIADTDPNADDAELSLDLSCENPAFEQEAFVEDRELSGASESASELMEQKRDADTQQDEAEGDPIQPFDDRGSENRDQLNDQS